MTTTDTSPGADQQLPPDAKVLVVQWDDGHVSAMTVAEVSGLYDLADCGYMDDVTAIYAVGRDRTLRPVRVGKQRRINTHDDVAFRYAAADIVTDDGRIVGQVTYTDH